MSKKPNFAVIIAYLKRRGIDYGYDQPKQRRMNYYCDDYDFCDVVSEAKRVYTMDNQSMQKKRTADKKG